VLNEVKRINRERCASYLGTILLFNHILLLLIASTANAVDMAALDVGMISGEAWKLEGVNVAVIDLNQKKPQFTMSATKLTSNFIVNEGQH
jgi:hypothetical protein